MKIVILLCYLVFPGIAFSADDVTGIGLIAQNILEPVNMVSDFICTASIIVGSSSLFGAFLKYTQYRKNPLVAPLSTIFLMLVIGIVLILLPFAYMLTENGIPFSMVAH